MIIGVIGATTMDLTAIRAMIKPLGHEVVVVCEDDVKESKGKTIAMCGSPLANIDINCFPQEITLPKTDNSYRGGSRVKGGKIKYARR